jgi:tetratricopeptide (TPR) repeat protein
MNAPFGSTWKAAIALAAMICTVAGVVSAEVYQNRIHGYVTDWQTRRPIEHAEVKLYQVSTAGSDPMLAGETLKTLVNSTFTDAEGAYEFLCGAGTFAVYAEQDGYRKNYEEVFFQSNDGVKQAVNIELTPNDVKISPKQKAARKLVDEAMAELQAGNRGKAMKKLKKALDKDPNCASAHNVMGVEYQRDGKLDKALECFRKAAAADPYDPVSRLNMANLLVVRGEYEAAIPPLDEALKLDDSSFKGYMLRGQAHYRLGHLEEANADLRKAREINAKDLGTGLVMLGNVNLKLKNYADSLAFFEQYLELHPDAPDAAKVSEVANKLRQALGQ